MVPLATGTRVGRWDVRHLLGSGAYGAVYRAFDAAEEYEVALKEYLPGHLARRNGPAAVMARSPQDVGPFAAGLESFVGDGRLLERLDHPSLLKVHEVWEQNGTAYLAMRLLTGRNLIETQQMRGKPPREPALRQLLSSLLDALEVLHAAGVQHADIAPQTILIEPNGRPVLLDMGSPRWSARVPDDPQIGGPRDGYAPIELYPPPDGGLARGPWTDFYALGAVLHYIILGRAPAPAPVRPADDRLADKLRLKEERYSPEFAAIIDWMLAPQPANRPQSSAELRDALAGQGLPKAYAPPPTRKLGSALKRRWKALAIGGTVIVLLAGALLVAYRLYRSGYLPWLHR